jgi:hypothetical protein
MILYYELRSNLAILHVITKVHVLYDLEAVPCGVTDIKRSEVQLLINPLCSLLVFLPPYHN